MPKLATENGAAAMTLRFLILTAARAGEVRLARWRGVDIKGALWTVPQQQTKAGREHRVPLSDDTLAILSEMAKLRTDANGYIFPGRDDLSNRAMLIVLERMGRDDLTAHGFRSTFRDWAVETGKPRDIAEAALAHVVGDKTVAAYQRGDLPERRRRLMRDWATFCASPPGQSRGQVISLRG